MKQELQQIHVDTVGEALRVVHGQLGEIMVPAGLIEEIGIPIRRAMNNIANIIRAEEEARQRREAAEAASAAEAEPADGCFGDTGAEPADGPGEDEMQLNALDGGGAEEEDGEG